MRFHIENINEKDRFTVHENHISLKHEEMKIEINLKGSGDTRNFDSVEILNIISDRLETIEKK